MTPQVRRRSGDLFTIQQHEIGPVVCDLPHSAGCDSKHRSGIATRAQCGFVAPRLPYLSPLARARALLARPWSARCYGVARQREGSRQNSIGGPRFPFTPASRVREGADGQAAVCPLLRGSSPTRGVAPKQHRGLRRAFTPAFFGLVLFIPWRVGAEESGAAKAARAAWI